MSFVKGWSRRLFFAIRESIGGTFAITTQPFIELNVKRGQQFEARHKVTGIATGAKKYYLLRTAADPIILKRRVLVTNSNEVNFKVSRTPTITGTGTPVFIRNYNEVAPNVNAVQVFVDPTFSATGTLRTQDYLPGSENAGNRSSGSFSQEGFERILAANTDFLLEIANDGTTNPLNFYLELSWYEGPIVPMGEDDEVIPTD